MTNRLSRLVPLFLALGLLSGIQAQTPVTGAHNVITCPDGRVVKITPFNPRPCDGYQPIDPTKDLPGDFLVVFGLPPTPTQNSLRDRIARVEYEQKLKTFQGLVDPPAGFYESNGANPSPAELFESVGFGQAVFYADVYGKWVRWPNALYGPARATFFGSTRAIGVVIAQYHTDKVWNDGACIPNLSSLAARSTQQRNAANCDSGEQE